jgi:hypothetical protein
MTDWEKKQVPRLRLLEAGKLGPAGPSGMEKPQMTTFLRAHCGGVWAALGQPEMAVPHFAKGAMRVRDDGALGRWGFDARP